MERYWSKNNDKNLLYALLSLSAFLLIQSTNPGQSVYLYIYIVPWFVSGYLVYCFMHRYYYYKYIPSTDELAYTVRFEFKTLVFCFIIVVALTINPGINDLTNHLFTVPYFTCLANLIYLPIKIIKDYHHLSS